MYERFLTCDDAPKHRSGAFCQGAKHREISLLCRYLPGSTPSRDSRCSKCTTLRRPPPQGQHPAISTFSSLMVLSETIWNDFLLSGETGRPHPGRMEDVADPKQWDPMPDGLRLCFIENRLLQGKALDILHIAAAQAAAHQYTAPCGSCTVTLLLLFTLQIDGTGPITLFGKA